MPIKANVSESRPDSLHPGPPSACGRSPTAATPRGARPPPREPGLGRQGPEDFPGTQAPGQRRTIGYVAAGLACSW